MNQRALELLVLGWCVEQGFDPEPEAIRELLALLGLGAPVTRGRLPILGSVE